MEDKTSSEQVQLWRSERHTEYHLRQFREPYRSTIHLIQCVRHVIGDHNIALRALDVGCGAGANIFHLGNALPQSRWVGIDIAPDLMRVARELIHRAWAPGRVQFVCGDFFQTTRILPNLTFDLVFSVQTISWLPAYEAILSELMALTAPGGWLFVTSLFTDSLVDATIQIRQLQGPEFVAEGPFYYNIYSIDRFEALCKALGASSVQVTDYLIDQDIPRPSHQHMGTYTERLADGRRLQVSGPLLMPWKVVAIRKESS
jgi:SAM-dependent methyltransferase